MAKDLDNPPNATTTRYAVTVADGTTHDYGHTSILTGGNRELGSNAMVNHLEKVTPPEAQQGGRPQSIDVDRNGGTIYEYPNGKQQTVPKGQTEAFEKQFQQKQEPKKEAK